jgi:hypothetical protein
MDRSLLKTITSSEIPSLLEKASLFGGKINQPTPATNIFSPIKSFEVDNGLITIKLFDEIELEKERPVSISLNYRSVSFQLDSKQFCLEGTTLTGPLPTVAKGLVIRDTERYVLPFNSQTMSSIYRIEKRGGTLDVDVTMVDISARGMGLLIKNAEEEMLLKNDHIWIRTINNVKLPEPIFAKVVYAINRKYKDGTLEIKAGISLEKEIPEELFRDLQQLCRLVLTA